MAVQGPTPADRQKASDLRAQAHAAWARKEWRTCMEDYFDADKLEPNDAQAEKESNECADRYEATMNAKPR